MYDPAVLRKQLIRHESYERKPYRDSEGIITIGVGWNLEEHGLPDDMIDRLLDMSITSAELTLGALLPGWETKLNNTRQIVLLDMAFNLGQHRLGGFKKMWAAVKAQDWEEAANQMMDSKWAGQVGVRASQLAGAMRLG